jgi:hypothetical protein
MFRQLLSKNSLVQPVRTTPATEKEKAAELRNIVPWTSETRMNRTEFEHLLMFIRLPLKARPYILARISGHPPGPYSHNEH